MPLNRHEYAHIEHRLERIERGQNQIECSLECIEGAILALAQKLPQPIDLKPAIEQIRALSAKHRAETAKINEALKQPTEPSTEQQKEK